MEVPPYNSCIVCLKGDTPTALGLVGEAAWIAAALKAKLGLPDDQAIGVVELHAEQNLDCEPGTVPDGRLTVFVRVCQECAANAGLQVADASTGSAPGYGQPA